LSNQSWDYIHGYSDTEQDRLIQQAEYWRHDLILRELNYQSGDKLLEIGCGAGAVLGILGTTFPDLQISGIDLEAKQINYATQHLKNLGLNNVDLKVGNASQLPWKDNTFDRIYAIWFLEHLNNPLSVLKEAYRVLKTGGTITITETDYRTIVFTKSEETLPLQSEIFLTYYAQDYQYLQNSLCELLLQSGGNPYIGQSLGNLLLKAGFTTVENQALPFHYYSNQEPEKLQQFIAYINSWLAPTVPLIVEKLGKDETRLNNGLAWFRSIGSKDNDAATAVVYRVSGVKHS
jgi:ubiquinone/menaquinone biosynthesis C-methylase UbiE